MALAVGQSEWVELSLSWLTDERGRRRLGPYDAIHVGAAAASMHQSLIDQLKAPGR